ncbi:MAG: c-type cytochrome, partial [Planctomycetes bacterium]|nr:c-type cytochrome [Planctomycetota bacterium]
ILEDTDADGRVDKVTVFAEGLNIPSGIAVGYGGVWVANSPDILFMQDTDGDGKADKTEVVVTGFGRADTHELPNSLTWGPDGWLYGLNGVFNFSHVKYPAGSALEKSKPDGWKFTCALFRIHPRTREFQVFCEGTSNPWGVAFDTDGSAFVSACVIDHLWHLVETGYYHRQGGPYPPFTWKIESIVKHKHQKAAYCGLHYFDSDAYPEKYRDKLYMGNIHGNCINSDELTRDGSTYLAKPRPDFLTANDAWFMPVAQKVGPDGCLYILDWYDRYHCYQDANRDPAGIDRLRGRLYRVVYKEYKPAPEYGRLHRLAVSSKVPRKQRLHVLWTMIGSGWIEGPEHQDLLKDRDPTFHAWGVRAASNVTGANAIAVRTKLRQEIAASASDSPRDVQLQIAIAARKLKGVDPLPVLLDVLAHCGDDQLIPHIVWQNLHPLLEKDGERFLTLAGKIDLAKAPGVAKLLPRAIDRILGNPSGDPKAVVAFLDKLADQPTPMAGLCLNALSAKVQNGEIAGPALEKLKKSALPVLDKFFKVRETRIEARFLSVTLGGDRELDMCARMFEAHPSENMRLLAMNALMTGRPEVIKESVPGILRNPAPGVSGYRGQVLVRLGKLNDPWVSQIVLAAYPTLNPDEQAKAIELVTQRASWAKALFKEIADKKISKDVVNVNQARRLLATKDKELAQLVEKHWGIPRDSRNPEREKIAAQMKELFKKTPGDPKAGVAHFKKVCAQCHKMYGEGVDVGPDITSNGRADFDQLLSNIFDPSLVIGAGYQAVTVNTKQGQVVTGLLVEDNAQRVVLKVQGGELKTIARKDVDEQFTSKLSMMPEDLEKQLRPQEIVDLLSYLSLDRPPDDPKARKIPGTPR